MYVSGEFEVWGVEKIDSFRKMSVCCRMKFPSIFYYCLLFASTMRLNISAKGE